MKFLIVKCIGKCSNSTYKKNLNMKYYIFQIFNFASMLVLIISSSNIYPRALELSLMPIRMNEIKHVVKMYYLVFTSESRI